MSAFTDKNLLILDAFNFIPNFDRIGEYNRTSGALVQNLGLASPYTNAGDVNPVRLNDGTILVYGNDSHSNSAIYKISKDGTPSDFILHAALHTGSIQALMVDSLDRIYHFTAPGSGNGNLRRFLPDGTFDADIVVPFDAAVSPYTTGLISSLGDTGNGGITSDGLFLFYCQAYFKAASGSRPRSSKISLTKLDIAGSTHSVIHDYLDTVTDTIPNPEYSSFGINFIDCMTVNPFTDKLYVSAITQHIISTSSTVTVPADGSVDILEVDKATGAATKTYTLSGGAVPGWQDDTGNPSSTGTWPGDAQYLCFDNVGNGHLWAALANDNRVPTTDNNFQIIVIDLGTDVISRLPGFIVSGTFANFGTPLHIFSTGGFPGLALYPAAADSAPVYGPAFNV